MTLAAIQRNAVALPPQERAALIDWLWESLDQANASAIEQRWIRESEDRIDAVDRGALPTVDGPQALENVRRTLRG